MIVFSSPSGAGKTTLVKLISNNMFGMLRGGGVIEIVDQFPDKRDPEGRVFSD